MTFKTKLINPGDLAEACFEIRTEITKKKELCQPIATVKRLKTIFELFSVTKFLEQES